MSANLSGPSASAVHQQSDGAVQMPAGKTSWRKHREELCWDGGPRERSHVVPADRLHLQRTPAPTATSHSYKSESNSSKWR